MRKAITQQIDALYDQGERPQKNTTTESIGLNTGKRSIVLVDNAGKKTPAGSYYEQKTGTELPLGGSAAGRPPRRQRGNNSAKRRQARHHQKVGRGQQRLDFYSPWKKYYSTLRRNYVADVPILIEGKRKNGTVYKIKSHMKIEKLGLRPVEVPLNLSHDQRVALVKPFFI